MRHTIYLWIYRCLLICGVILVSFYAIARISGSVSSHAALQAFDDHSHAAEADSRETHIRVPGKDEIDFSLWSQQRIKAFIDSTQPQSGSAIAVLKLERLRMRVPVFEGTDDVVLNEGAGWIEGTAKPGQKGNVAIAAHRDGFFRVLKDVQLGDVIELQLPDRTMFYRVRKTEIVQPDDNHVLLSQQQPTLTLVTCYPFYYVGSAPERFIVEASLIEKK